MSIFVYHCKLCGDPIEQANQGELLCVSCAYDERTTEEQDLDAQIDKYRLWASTHCPACEEPQPEGALCPACEEEWEPTAGELVDVAAYTDSAWPAGLEVEPSEGW